MEGYVHLQTSTKITYDCYKRLYRWFNVIRFARQLRWSECESWCVVHRSQSVAGQDNTSLYTGGSF